MRIPEDITDPVMHEYWRNMPRSLRGFCSVRDCRNRIDDECGCCGVRLCRTHFLEHVGQPCGNTWHNYAERQKGAR